MGPRMGQFIFSTCVWVILFNDARSQTITQGPGNMANINGEPSSMDCRISGLTSAMEWIFFPNGTTQFERVYYYDAGTGVEEKPYPGQFDVDSTGLGQGIFDLMILETSPGMAGDYQCRVLQPLDSDRANFVSVGDVSCTPGPGERHAVVGEFVFLDCSVSYTGYKAPYLNWMGDNSNFPGERTSDFENSRVVSNVTAAANHDMMEFRCDLSFVTQEGDMKAAPGYNDSCTTYFRVLHGATSIIITPDPGDVVTISVGEYVNCTASGNPDPDILWEDVNGGVQYPVENLLILEEWQNMMKIFTCIAMNRIDGIEHFARLNISLNVLEAPSSPSTTTGGVETWVIVVAVLVPLVVLAAVGVAVFFVLRNKKKKKKKQKQNAATAAVVGGGPRGPGPAMHFTNVSQAPTAGAPPPRGHYPPGPGPIDPASNGRVPPLMAGMPVAVPPGAESKQQALSGKDSPGYGDLGIKQFGSTSDGLDSSVEFDPDPRRPSMNPQGSQGNLYSQGASRGARGSQASLLGADAAGNSTGRYGNVPGENLQGENPATTKASINRAPMSRGQMGSQASLSHVVPARGNLGSQGSLSQMQAARGYMGSQGSVNRLQPAQGYMGSQGSINHLQAAQGFMGSQGSIHHLQAAQGYMGSQRSLASQRSREYGHVPLQIHEIPDTTV